jgi:hypothetical protein
MAADSLAQRRSTRLIWPHAWWRGVGRSFFQELPAHVELRLLEVVPAPGVTHLHDEVAR